MFACAVEQAARAAGAVYRAGETVVGYRIEGGGIRGVVTDKGEYSSETVVLAAGADAAEHGSLLGIDIPVVPDSHEAGISAPIEHFLPPLVVDMRQGAEGKTANFYFGQIHSGQIIFCYTPKEIFVGHNRYSISEFMPTLAGRLVSLIPKFRNLLIRRVWRGLYPMTPDAIPIVDRVKEIEGLVLAVGMCGQGFMMGPGIAKNITSMIVDGEPLLPEQVQKTFSFYRDFHASPVEALK